MVEKGINTFPHVVWKKKIPPIQSNEQERRETNSLAERKNRRREEKNLPTLNRGDSTALCSSNINLEQWPINPINNDGVPLIASTSWDSNPPDCILILLSGPAPIKRSPALPSKALLLSLSFIYDDSPFNTCNRETQADQVFLLLLLSPSVSQGNPNLAAVKARFLHRGPMEAKYQSTMSGATYQSNCVRTSMRFCTEVM